MIRRLGAFFAAVAVTYVLAAIVSTQAVLARLPDMGIGVTATDRIRTTLHDLGGMASSFLPLVAAALLIAFFASDIISRFLPAGRTLRYGLAGGVAIVVLHLALEAAFDIIPLAVARTTLGLTLQAATGVVGGLVFAQLTPAQTS